MAVAERRYRYSDDQVTRCLMAVIAWAGNTQAAHEALKAEGAVVPDRKTLHYWTRTRYAARYNELRARHSEDLEAQLAHEFRDVARLAVDVERIALEQATILLKEGRDKDPGRTAANAATVADKMTTKLLAVTGRPTSIREDRTLPEVLRWLAAKQIIQAPEIAEVSEVPAEESQPVSE